MESRVFQDLLVDPAESHVLVGGRGRHHGENAVSHDSRSRHRMPEYIHRVAGFDRGQIRQREALRKGAHLLGGVQRRGCEFHFDVAQRLIDTVRQHFDHESGTVQLHELRHVYLVQSGFVDVSEFEQETLLADDSQHDGSSAWHNVQEDLFRSGVQGLEGEWVRDQKQIK